MKNFLFLFFALTLWGVSYGQNIRPEDGQFLSKCPTCPTETPKMGVVVWLGNANLLEGYYETYTYQAVAIESETAKYYTKILSNIGNPTLGLMQFVNIDYTWRPMDMTNFLIHTNALIPDSRAQGN